jgi:drug/metabolite transporter (DMT)-like permease
MSLAILLAAFTDLASDSAVLGSYFLDEKLGVLGKLGCALCLLGSVIIVLHAPPDEEIGTVDEILNYAIQPGRYPNH